MEKKIEILSQLTVDEINELRLIVSLSFHAYGSSGIQNKINAWADLLNQASERKQEDYYTQFEHVTDNNPLFT